MIDTRTFLKIPYNFENKCQVFPPTLEEVMKSENFNIFYHLLFITQEEIEDESIKRKTKNFLTPLEYLLNNCYNDKKIEEIAIEGFKFFCHTEVTFLYKAKSILIGTLNNNLLKIKKVNDLNLINEDCYFDFQNLLRRCMGIDPIEKPDPNEHPRIREMKAKARYRDRIKAKQGGGLSMQSCLEAICCMGIGITPLNIGQLSYASISAIMQRYQLKEKYELDINSLLAGAKPSKVSPVYWIKN